MGHITERCFILVVIAVLCATGLAADFPFSFFIKSEYTGALFVNKTAEIEYLNETECASACLYAHEIHCSAFEYDFENENCYLVSSDDVTNGVNVTENKDSHYYTKLSGPCPNPPVGLEDGTVPLSRISMSSYMGGVENGPLDMAKDHVRLNSPGGWCAGESTDINNITDWIQIDFSEPKMIGAVSTQGFNHPDLDNIYCSQYYLSYRFIDSTTDTDWVIYEESGSTMLFDGNTNSNGIVNNTLATPVKATSIRLHPTICQNHPCMRLEFYGCRVDCEPNPCMHVNATCSDTSTWVWNVTCDCPTGLSGDFCQVNYDECASNPCQNGGKCVDGVDRYTCDCADGFEGDHCQTNIDECASNPCQNGGTCEDGDNGYKCICVDGWGGGNCTDYDVDCAEGYFAGLNSCYMLELTNTTTYYWAEQTCRSIGGHLLFPSTSEEQSVVSDILNAQGISSSVKLMTGLRYDSTEDTVAFSDGSGSPSFNGWESSSPSGSAECVAMVADGSSWAWENVDCTSDRAYICEQEKAHGNFTEWGKWEECSVTCGPGEGWQIRRRTCTNPAPFIGGDDCQGNYTQNRTCGTICPIVECPSGFITNYDTCYLLQVNESATYDEAKADCQNLTIYGGHLLFVNNFDEETFIADVLAEYYADNSLKYFTGAKIDVISGNVTFDWEYGSSEVLNLTSWDAAGSSMWSSGSADTTDTNNQCILLEKSGSTWKAANEQCSQSLGYVCEVNLGDGNWGAWHPWGECNATCGSGHQTRIRLCDDPAPILGGANCTGISEETRTCEGACPSVTCPAGFDAFGESCYMVMDYSTDFTDQNTARKACLSLTNDTGHLAYVQSFAELEFLGFRLEESMFGYERSPVYVGLTHDNGDLYYANDTMMVNVTGWNATDLWVTDYPSANNWECMAMFYDEDRHQWLLRDIPCYRELGYICEITQTAGNWGSWLGWSMCDTTCGNGTQVRKRLCDDPPPILNGTDCIGDANETRACTGPCDVVTCPPGFDVYHDSCYKFFVNESDRDTLDNANVTCKILTNYTGRVVRVDSYEEQFFLNWGLKDRSVARGDKIFVGHTYDSSSSTMLYYGSSESGPSTSEWPNGDWWASSYPRNLASKECVALVYNRQSQEYLFGDVSCEDENGFICEIPQTPGGVGEWGPWSQCTDSCGSGTQVRTRECNNPTPVLDGQFCQDSLNDTRSCVDRCSIVQCPDGWITSYDSCYKQIIDSMADYSSANHSCTMLTNDTGHLLYINNQTELDEVSWLFKKRGESETIEYLTGMFYESSSLSFDDGIGAPDASSWRSAEGAPWVKHYPSGAGTCVGLAYNDKTWEWRLINVDCTDSMYYICEITQTDGNWGSWGDWSSCSQTCDESANMGTRHRNRTCSDPAPILDGNYCEGNRTEYGACGSQCPPVHGNYSDWINGECSVSCYSWDSDGNRYGGFLNRTRNCTNPEPMYGGNNCTDLGDEFETVSCGTEDGNACPAIDGNWGSWSNWTSCNVTCGSGYKIRTRNCDSPSPEHGGTDCEGDDTDYWSCTKPPCAIDGNWTEWSSWSVCSQTCVGGTQYRNRSCTDPTPMYNGTECSGDDIQWQNCSSDVTCPVHGGWSEWSSWSACTLSCGGNGTSTRNRSCNNPSPAHEGDSCPADESSEETEICGNHECPIDGGYSDWGSWSGCSINCGEGGVSYRYRACDNPAPQYGGLDCDLYDLYLRQSCDAMANCTAEREDFYQYKPTSQSSTASGGDSYRAVDSDVTSDFSSGSCIETNVEYNPWWQVDLGGVYQVRSVSIYVRTDDCIDCTWTLTPFVVRLGVSSTPKENLRCGNIVESSTSSSAYDVDCNLMAGRYLSIQNVADSDTSLSFCEVVVKIGSYAYFDGSSNVTFSDAQTQCYQHGAELATPGDLLDLYDNGDESCDWGWASDGSVRRVAQASGSCGNAASSGVVDLGSASGKWGVYCIQRSEGKSLIEELLNQTTFNASSSMPDLDPSNANVYNSNNTLGWVPVNSTDGEWLEVDFGQYVALNGIATRGRPCCDGYVTGYYLSYSIDGTNWTYYGSGETKLIQGNMDATSVVRHSLDPIEVVRYVRVEPKTWDTAISLRVDFYGNVQPVNGEFGSWTEWGTCSVACEGTGTQQRTRSCDSPAKQGDGLRCRKNVYMDQILDDPLHFFRKVSNSQLGAGQTVTYSVTTDQECATLCALEESFHCESFDFSAGLESCVLSNTSNSFSDESLGLSLDYDYYELDYSSCNVHYIVSKARGSTPRDGTYEIKNGASVINVYCDMTRDGGGWTLVVTAASASGWNTLSTRLRNANSPSLEADYSILSKADDMKGSGKGKTFKYRLESIERGRWGGIYEVPFNYSFTNDDSSQTSTLVEMFDAWRTNDTSLQHIMPWLTSGGYGLLRAHDNTGTASPWAGTIICDCADLTWSAYTSWYTADDEAASSATTMAPTSVVPTTEAYATTPSAVSTQASGGSRRKRDIDPSKEGDEEFDDFKYMLRIGEQEMRKLENDLLTRRKRSVETTFGTVWYWLREDHYDFTPSMEFDMSGRCSYDTDIKSCGEPCSENVVPASEGKFTGTLKGSPTLTKAREGAEHKCATSLDNNYVDLGDQTESCLYDPTLCQQGLTIAFWVKLTPGITVDETTYIISSAGLEVSVSDDSGNLQLNVALNDDNYFSLSNSTIPSSEWFHVMITYKRGNGLRLFLNGDLSTTQASSNTAAQTLSDTLTNVYFGGNYENASSSAYDVEVFLSDLQIFYRKFSTMDAKLFYLGSNADAEGQTCGDGPCPVHGGWTAFEDVGSCSVQCGSNGVIEQWRNCSNPTPQHGGDDCIGENTRYTSCQLLPCLDTEDSALGMELGNITDSYLTESECSASNDSCATWARLNDADSTHCWMPNGTEGVWLQIELEYPVSLKGVATSGRPSDNSYVTEYEVYYSADFSEVYSVMDGNSTKIFQGNYNNTNVVRHDVNASVDVRYVRFFPISWNNAICMRVELYGEYLPVNGKYGPWGDWSECNVTCGGGIQFKNRTCDNPSPKFGGQSCQDSATKSRECNTNNCPIDGGWSAWETVVNCSVSCGSDGIRREYRECNNPPKQYGGAPCEGDEYRWVSCSGPSCSGYEETELGIINGDIGDSQFSESSCSSTSTCGNVGRLDSSTSTDCWIPVNSTTSEWLEVNLTDSVTLVGMAIQGRSSDDLYVTSYYMYYWKSDSTRFKAYKDVNRDKMLFQGNIDNTNAVRYDLDGLDDVTFVRFEPQSWNGSICMRVALYGYFNPINGSYGEWSNWSNCSVTCGGGVQYRNRTCTNPAPKYGGEDCSGSSWDVQDCNNNNCPIDGGLSDWYDVTNCSVSCGTLGTVRQERDCTNPKPRYGGDSCHGYRQQWVSCNAGTNCDSQTDYSLGVADASNSDVTFSASSKLSAALAPSNAKLDDSDTNAAWTPDDNDDKPYLEIMLQDIFNLKRVATQGRLGSDSSKSWVETFFLMYKTNDTSWRKYKENGYKKIFQANYDESYAVYNELDPMISNITHVRFYPLDYNGSIAMRVDLFGKFQPRDGEWTEWSDWTSCPVTCGGSWETRNRTCTNPTPAYGGADCPASENADEQRACNTQPCPIDGDWTDWASWSSIDCSISCGTDGIKHRTRSCTNPPAQYGGAECTNPGYTEEFEACDAASACAACYEPLGMYDGRIADSQISASNERYNNTNLAVHARLENTASGALCWEGVPDFNVTDYELTYGITNTSYNFTDYWLQIDFPIPIKVSMLGVQGGGTIERWVSYYNLSLSTDGINWYDYEEDGETKMFYGNIDKSTIVRSTLDNVQEGIKSLRIIPMAWEGGGPCLRAEVYGCFDIETCNDAKVTPDTSKISASGNDPEYVRVDLGSLQRVTQIDTDATGNNWMQSYYMYFSQNDFDWVLYVEDGKRKDFIGNHDSVTTVTNALMNPFHAQYLKVVAISNQNDLMDDVEVYTCSATVSQDSAPASSVCFTPFGFADRTFNSTEAFSASSIYPSSTNMSFLPEYARLHNPSNPASGLQGWVSVDESTDANYSSIDQYYQLDFGYRVTLTGLALQGVLLENGTNATFDRFSLWFSEDAVDWKPMRKMGSSDVKILDGPTTGDMVVLHELIDDLDSDIRPLDLRYLRIKSEFNTTGPVGLRMELYGCTARVDTVCPEGTSYFQTSCYKVFTEGKSRQAAQNDCANYGAHLATITSVDEQKFLRKFVRAYDMSAYNIGFKRYGKTFRWIDDTFVVYTSWAEEQPLYERYKKCVALSKDADGAWVSVDCDDKIGFVCEFERDSTDVFACGENTVSLHCADNQKVNITAGDWGRTMDWEVCPQESTFSASAMPCTSIDTSYYTAIENFASDCSNVTHCSMLADTSTLDYPCSTANMQLHINLTYTCVDYMKYARACEGDFLDISCPATNEVIHIMDAMYGRTLDNSVCPGPDRYAPTNCTLNKSIRDVRSYCEGHHSCKFAIEVEAFSSDPCDGVAKYLDVNYTCVSAAPVIPDEYTYQGDCEEGWTKHDSRCIKGFPNQNSTFYEAEEKCNNLHGHLAGVPGDHTQSFLEGLMTDYADTHFWIGCVKTKNNTCRWRDGIGHVFSDFSASYISDGKQRCIHLSADHSFKWEDARCSDRNAFICQQDCVLAFGMADKTIRNDQLKVSSTKMLSSLDSFKWDGRLNDPYGAWVASDKETQQWFQVDFERVMRVRKFATQGHPRYDYWISRYAMDYTVNDTLVDDGLWNSYEEEGERRIFVGNNDSSTVVYQYLTHFMYARYIRLLPLNWTNEISLRLEVYGCFLEDEKPEVLEVINSTKLHYEYNGTIQCLAFGMPLPNITWIRDGYSYEGNENATIVTYALDDHHVISEIRFHPLWDDRGYYTCVAKNQHGSDRSSFYNYKGTPLNEGGKIICDDEDLNLQCPVGEYIQITGAFYGRMHNEKCIIYDDYYPTDCEYDPETVMYRMQRQCDKKEHCIIHTSEAMFGAVGDNYTLCDGFTKYINMTYECIGYDWTEWYNTDSPSDGIEDESHYSIYKMSSNLCADPQNVECRQASDGQSHYALGQVLQRPCSLNNEGGLLCYDSDQSSDTCKDYEVRFLCPGEELGIWGHEKVLECDDEELAIACQADYSIKIHKAFYGRREEGLCSVGTNYTYSLDCELDQELVLKMVQKNCDNKQTCRLNVEFATVLSDPCPEQPKYLDVRFSCERYRSDFARGKSANMSSLSSSAEVVNATTDYIFEVDCNEGWCTQSADEYEPWWVVDLQATYDINVVTVYTCDDANSASTLDNFQVRIGNSSDINLNDDCGDVVFSAQPGPNAVFCNHTMRGRYISIQLMERTDSIQICEVTVQHLGPSPIKAMACDDQLLELSCAVNEIGYLKIENVFYGRREDGKHCPHRWSNHTYDTNCAADTTTLLNLVKDKCENERQCSVDITSDILNSLSSDPCQGELKYLEVEYTCQKFLEGNNTLSSTYAVCKEEDLQIACYGSNRFIEITSASYKPVTATSPSWCTESPSDNSASCSSQDVQSVVAANCDNKVTCTVRADDYFLGATSCTTHKMQLEVTLDCKDELPTGEISLFGCEGLDAELSLSCPDGTYISIKDAFYGRTQVGSSSYVCPAADGNDATTTCRSSDTQAIVESYCQDQRTCSIPVDGSILTSSDPCSSISSKYLQVDYECLAGRPLNDITLYACQDHDDLSVECPADYPYVRIIEAEYGRTEDQFRCAYRENLPSFTSFQGCDTPGVLTEARSLCTNERNCTVPSHWKYYVSEEPCVGTYKYLRVTYRCLMGPIDFTRGYRWFFVNPHHDLKNYALSNHLLGSYKVRNFLECVNRCLANTDCVSFNYKDVWTNNGYPCQLSDMIVAEVPYDFGFASGFEYYEKDSYRVR